MRFIPLLLFLFACTAGADELQLEKYRGQVVYLDFWASWCSPCKDSFPWLNQLQKKYHDKGVVVIGINLDTDRAKADEFLKSTPAQFPVVFDSGGALAKKFGVQGMPYAVILGRDGKVGHSHIGFHADKTKDYEQALQGVLK